MADGDGRYVLTLAETLFAIAEDEPLDTQALAGVLQRRAPAYDKDREEHYNLISALHKSIRGSDPDASLYWLARMLQGGEEPLFIARRLVRAAAEDIGTADPTALLDRHRRQGRLRLPRLARGGAGTWPRWWCIWPPRPNPTPSTKPSAPRVAPRKRPARSCRPPISAMRPPS